LGRLNNREGGKEQTEGTVAKKISQGLHKGRDQNVGTEGGKNFRPDPPAKRRSPHSNALEFSVINPFKGREKRPGGGIKNTDGPRSRETRQRGDKGGKTKNGRFKEIIPLNPKSVTGRGASSEEEKREK